MDNQETEEIDNVVDSCNVDEGTKKFDADNENSSQASSGTKHAIGLSHMFKKKEKKTVTLKSPAVPYVCSSSPILTRDLTNRRKTIMNTFCLSTKEEYNTEPYQLYRDTIADRAKILYEAASKAFDEDSYESCLSFLHKAMIMEPNNSKFYILRGETYLQLCDFKSAILNYKRVCILEPEDEQCFSKLAFIYFLQGQSYYDEQLFLDALECFTRAAEMKPENSGYHARSIACLSSLKRHKECLQMINHRLIVEAANPDFLILRARLHLLFCNATLAYFDVKEARSLDPGNNEADLMQQNLEQNAEQFKERAIHLDMSGKTKEAIMKISQAIDTNPELTEYHILRAGMHRRNLDFNAAVDDLLLAMDKTEYNQSSELYTRAQKQLLLTFNDFAVDCFRKSYYEEAIVLLEKAIQGEKNDHVLYINRGDCFYKLEHLHFAMLDYQQAQELDANNKSIALRLSIVYNDLGILEYNDRKYYRAEDYFSLSISYDCENAMFYLSRARTRYMQEKTTEAQVDIISALHLDRNNKEMLSIFARLYPGKTADEILRSEFGMLVCEAVDSVITESKPKEVPDCDAMNRSSPLPNISIRLAVHQKLQQCMEDKDFNVSIIKGRKKVNDLVECVIQSRQDLKYTGPKLTTSRPRTNPKNQSTNHHNNKQK